ncbi:hypothetical protein [Clostridium celatum]|uniref:Phage DNA packaging protein n=1 Tax=Clostridium celatum DSM 1785 TaxID=545697 RepID=L1QF36_9CLOT|nr:hypothetical protein [Clostridium celatum]EKY26556.1 hypothetical protein HMPREF0216_01741 [Clostridium celatum DSM 1785]
MKSSAEYRKILNDPIWEDDEDYIRENVYDEIKVGIGDVIAFVKCYDEGEYVDLLEMFEVAEIWIDSTYGEGYKKNENAKTLARHMAKTLTNSMYFNRSFEISSSAKTSIIIKNIGAKLACFEEEG